MNLQWMYDEFTMIIWYLIRFPFHIMKVWVAFMDRETAKKPIPVTVKSGGRDWREGDIDGGIQTDEHLL